MPKFGWLDPNNHGDMESSFEANVYPSNIHDYSNNMIATLEYARTNLVRLYLVHVYIVQLISAQKMALLKGLHSNCSRIKDSFWDCHKELESVSALLRFRRIAMN